MITTGSFLRLLSLVLICLVTAAQVPSSFAATAPDEQFVTIYSLSQEGDSLAAKGNKDDALKKYQQAQSALLQLKRANPNWNTKVVGSRLSDLNAKIATLTQPASAEDSTTAGTDATAAGGSVKKSDGVKLLSPGSEPRRLLRLEPKVGQVQTSVMTMKMDMEMQMGSVPGQAMKMPAMVITMETAVKSVAENGDIAYETVVKDATIANDPDVPAEMVEAMKPAMEEMKGMTASGILTARGFSRDVEISTSAQPSAQLQQGLDQAKDLLANLGSPLPEEPVGIGARWEATMPIKSQGMTIRQTITQEITGIDGEQVKMASGIQQTARNQKVSNPAMPSVKIDVPQMNTKGTGTTTIALGRVLPVHTSVKSSTQMTLSMNMGNQRQNMGMKLGMDVTIEEKN